MRKIMSYLKSNLCLLLPRVVKSHVSHLKKKLTWSLCRRRLSSWRRDRVSLRVCTVQCEKGPRNHKTNSPKSTKVKKTEKRRLNYVPISYCLLFSIILLR